MPLSISGKNTCAQALADAIDTASLHDGAPGESGANEISGGTYARKTVTWDTASGGTSDLAASVTFDVASGAEVQYVGFWDGTDFKGYVDVADATFGGDGTYTVNSGSIGPAS